MNKEYEEVLDNWKEATEKLIEYKITHDDADRNEITIDVMNDATSFILNFINDEYISIRKRKQREDIEKAKANNVKFDRPTTEYDKDQILSLYEKVQSGELTMRKAAEKAGLPTSTFYTYVLKNNYF